jgi:hypothetical protein
MATKWDRPFFVCDGCMVILQELEKRGNNPFPSLTVLLKFEVPALSTIVYFDVKGYLFNPTSPVVCISLGTEV